MNLINSVKIIFTFLIFTMVFSCKNEIKTTNKLNIIFFIADDMYPHMFNFLPEGKGKNLTPAMDSLASEGTVMHHQYVVSPVCTPSRYNCLTGNYASRATNQGFINRTQKEEGQTVIQWNTHITENQKILPHYLKEHGYATGMVGKNHVIEAKGLHFFKDYNADPKDPEIDALVKENYRKAKQAVLNAGFDYAGAIYHNNPNFIGLKELAVQNMDWIAQAGLEFIEQNHDSPFFLYFATTIPHGPVEPERSWKANPRITAKGYLEEAPNVLPARHTLPERIKEAGLEGNNKELILWLDDALAALMNKLEEHNILDNTIIFFFNDHGQQAKGTLYQGGVLNPSIVWKKGGFTCGNTSQANIQNIDFTPTILDFAGINQKNYDFDGKSFKPILDEAQKQVHESMYFELGYGRAIIKDNYKYYAIRYPEYAREMSAEERADILEAYNEGRRFRNMQVVNEDPAAPFSHFETIPGGGQAEHGSYGKKPAYFERDQLYDLSNDPEEKNNLADDPEYQDIMKELKKELRQMTDKLPGNFPL